MIKESDPMKINIFKTKEELYKKVASYYVDVLQRKPHITLGLATGSTPINLYQKLIDACKQGLISFKDVTTINLDEYIGLSSIHPQSYRAFMNQHLFNHVDIKIEKTFVPNGTINPFDAAIAYQEIINKYPIDLQLLGLGGNGHIGFNEPDTSFESLTHVVQLKAETRLDNQRFFKSLDEVPTHAITMGIKEVIQAKEIILIATGLSKADAVKAMIEGSVTEKVPASILQKHPHAVIFIDEDAASKLSHK